MAAEGLRVLGVARAVHDDGELPDSPRDFAFDFVGLVGLSDPLRASAAAAVKECRSAGIRVIMITGDYPETAASIARQAGLEADHVMTGEALETMDEAELGREIGAANVFARIMPEQKLRIVNALKANGGHRQLKRTLGQRKAIFLRGEVRPQRLSWRSRAKPRRRAGAKRGGSRR
jgi:Ca2+-transporting ATPase